MRKKLLLCGAFLVTAPIGFILIFVVSFSIPNYKTDKLEQSSEQSFFLHLFRAFRKEESSVQGAATTQDARVILIERFYARYNSPLQNYADFIVKTADKYRIDYRLIPAISMQESTGCKFIPENSYNCWGYGIYGNKVTRFSSYEEAIDTVSRGLRKNYYDKGLTTPQSIMAKYTPPSLEKEGAWAKGVYFFFDAIENPTEN